MGAKHCHAHAVCHRYQDSDTRVDYLPNPHQDSDGHADSHEYSPKFDGDQHQRSHRHGESNARAQLHSHGDRRVSHYTANCYRYRHCLPICDLYPYYPHIYSYSLTVGMPLPSGA